MKKLFIIFSAAILGLVACKKDFLDVNQPVNSPVEVTDALLLSAIQVNDAFNVAGGFPARIAAMWTQQLAYNQPAPDWDTYKVLQTDVDNTWTFDLYASIMNNLKILDKQSSGEGNNHYTAISRILLAYNLGVTTDFWGDIPYSQAFQGAANLKPAYDSQQSIYTEIQNLLDQGIALCDESSNSAPGSDDFIYSGDMARWKRFAYHLKARFYMHLTKAPGFNAVTQANLALTALSNGFTGPGDDATLFFYNQPGGQNPWTQLIDPSIWGSIVMSATFVDSLTAHADPRIPFLMDTAINGGGYIGRVSGTPTAPSYQDYSMPSGYYVKPDAPVFFASYDEALFIRAEATLLVSGFAAAQPMLNDAITAHMTRLGVNGTDITTYLAAHAVINATNAYERIMTEKYIANYLSLETYNDWRRTGFPLLTKVQSAFTSDIPRKWLYPSSELLNNAGNVPYPANNLMARVWWDTP